MRDSPDGAEALAQLCSTYWFPVFAFVRRRGYSVDEAQDLTQGFFTRIIEKGELRKADRARGTFRTFLLTACQHFLSNERDRELALKRGGGARSMPIELAAAEQRYQRSLAHDETPELVFHRQWSLALLTTVLDSLREEYASKGKAALFDRLRGFLTLDASNVSHAAIAADLGMSPAAVKVAVHRLRRRYRDALREHVADTASSPAEVDAELRELLRNL